MGMANMKVKMASHTERELSRIARVLRCVPIHQSGASWAYRFSPKVVMDVKRATPAIPRVKIERAEVMVNVFSKMRVDVLQTRVPISQTSETEDLCCTLE